MKKSLVGVFFGTFVLALIAWVSGPVTASAEKRVTVGNIADLTGPVASVGVPTGAGREDYFQFINEKGGVLGYQIKSIFLDGAESVTAETRHFNRLLTKDKALAIMGFSTHGTRALAPIACRKGIFYLGTTCTRDVVRPKEYPYVFIFSPTYLDQFKMALDYVKKTGAKDIVVVRQDLDAWKVVFEGGFLDAYAKKLGLNIKDNIVCPAKVPDLTTFMLRAQKSNPDLIVSPNTPSAMVPMIRDGIKIGFPANKIVGASLWTTHPVIAKKFGDQAEGYVGLSTFPLYYSNNSITREIKEYAKKHPKKVKKFEGNTFYIQGWMQAKMVCLGLKSMLEKNNGKMPGKLKEARKQFNDAYENLQGKLMGDDLPPVDNRDHKGWHSAFFASPKDGKFVQTSEWMTLK